MEQENPKPAVTDYMQKGYCEECKDKDAWIVKDTKLCDWCHIRKSAVILV